MALPHLMADENGCKEVVSFGNNSLHYDELLASDANKILPNLSGVGRGPAGKGNVPIIIQTDDTTFIIQFGDSKTGEVLLETPNLHPGKITAETIDEEHTLILYLTRGNEKKELCKLTLPQGETGSRIFTHKTTQPIHTMDDYIAEISAKDLAYNKIENPEPRVYDVVLSYVYDLKEVSKTYFAAGTVVDVTHTADDDVVATVVFHTLYSLASGGSLEQQQVDFLQEDPTQVDYIKHRELIQRALNNGKYISLNAKGDIDIENFADESDIKSIFN